MEKCGVIAQMAENKKKFQLDDKKWYSRNFDPEMDFKPGDKVQFEYQQNGKWLNIQGDPVKVGETTPPELPQKRQWSGGGNRGGWHAYQDKEYQEAINQRITKQNALNNAVAYAALEHNEVETVDDVLKVAQRFVEWVNGKADG